MRRELNKKKARMLRMWDEMGVTHRLIKTWLKHSINNQRVLRQHENKAALDKAALGQCPAGTRQRGRRRSAWRGEHVSCRAVASY